MSASRSALPGELLAAIEAGAQIVTSNRRAAHWLRLLYANHATMDGRLAWATPRITSFDDFVAESWTGPQRQERVLTARQTQLLWDRIVRESRQADHLLSPQLAAKTSFRAWERLQAWRISQCALGAAAEEHDSEEARALLEWSVKLESLCREQSWIPIAQLPERLAQKSDPLVGTIVFASADELLPVHRAVFDSYADRGARVEHAQVETSEGRSAVYICESPSDEFARAAAWALDSLQRGAQSVGVAVSGMDQRATELRRVFAETFAQKSRSFLTTTSEYDARRMQAASFLVATYHELAEFPCVRAALDLLQLAGGKANAKLVGTVLRNAYVNGSTAEASSRALLEARLRSEVRERYELGWLELVTASSCPILSQAFKAVLAAQLDATSLAMPSAMAERFSQLWRMFGWPGDINPDSDEQQIISRLRECLSEFGALDDLLGPLSYTEAAREFEAHVRNTTFEPRGTPASVTIVDVQGIDGLHFDALWVTGMTESLWPPPPTPDPFIPIGLQISAGIADATATRVREQARRRFNQLRGLAADIVFSCPRTVDDVEVLPCAWLSELSTLTEAPEPAIEYAAKVFAHKPVLETAVEAKGRALLEYDAAGGTRIFELQSHCPFRAYAELRLGALPLDRVVPNVDARERGTLLHAALADVWRTLKDSERLRASTFEQLEALTRTQLARHAGKLLEGASPHRVRMIQIEQDLAAERILSLLALDAARPPFQVAELETAERAVAGSLQFKMRLDRVDELLSPQHNRGRVIIDYKSSHSVSARSWFSDRPEQPQLPVYAVTHPQRLVAVAFATLSAKGVGYQGIADIEGVLPEVKQLSGKQVTAEFGDWKGLMDHWQTVVTRLANEFAEGEARVDPLPNACRYCHLSTVCRIHEMTLIGSEDEP
jgi:probable DNA repair protein